MTQEEILALKPGVELNRLAAEKIMNNRVIQDEIFGYMERSTHTKSGDCAWGYLDPYSEDLEAASLIVDKMLSLGYEDAIYWADFGQGKYKEPEAICKAALLAISEESGQDDAADKIIQQVIGKE